MMKNKSVKTAAATIFGLLMLIGSAQFFVPGQESKNESSQESRENSGRRSIVGTWQTVVTPRNCATGVPVAPAFLGILTFHQGETLTGTSTAVSSVYGVCEREQGRRNYSFAFVSLRYNSTGVFTGTQKVRQTVEISTNGSEFTSTGTVEILDVNGNAIGNGCSTSTGTRFE